MPHFPTAVSVIIIYMRQKAPAAKIAMICWASPASKKMLSAGTPNPPAPYKSCRCSREVVVGGRAGLGDGLPVTSCMAYKLLSSKAKKNGPLSGS